MVRYDTVRYCTVRYGDAWITKDNAIIKLIRSYELSKNCSEINVPSVMKRTGELGNTDLEPYIPSHSQDQTMELRTRGNREK